MRKVPSWARAQRWASRPSQDTTPILVPVFAVSPGSFRHRRRTCDLTGPARPWSATGVTVQVNEASPMSFRRSAAMTVT